MPTVPVNYVAVVVAALANMVIGYVWFGPLFGKMYMRLQGMTQEQTNAARMKT